MAAESLQGERRLRLRRLRCECLPDAAQEKSGGCSAERQHRREQLVVAECADERAIDPAGHARSREGREDRARELTHVGRGGAHVAGDPVCGCQR
jgi:hypothetical protein